jgi:GNAT superfamily N-acetyltransferase
VVPQAYLDSVGVDERQRRWADRILGTEREVLVVEDGDVIVAVASWGDGSEGRELTSLYVAAEHRGSGLADDLMDRSVGNDPAQLWVFGDNPRAHVFYARHGFVATGAHTDDPDTGLTIVQLRRGQESVRTRP